MIYVFVDCSLALRRARRVQSCVTACSANAVLRTECSAGAVLHTGGGGGSASNHAYLIAMCPRTYFNTVSATAKKMACI